MWLSGREMASATVGKKRRSERVENWFALSADRDNGGSINSDRQKLRNRLEEAQADRITTPPSGSKYMSGRKGPLAPMVR